MTEKPLEHRCFEIFGVHKLDCVDVFGYYEGPINIGDCFLWEPLLGHASSLVRVVDIQEPEEYQSERTIWTKGIQDGSIMMNQEQDQVIFNDESRFREACIPRPTIAETVDYGDPILLGLLKLIEQTKNKNQEN